MVNRTSSKLKMFAMPKAPLRESHDKWQTNRKHIQVRYKKVSRIHKEFSKPINKKTALLQNVQNMCKSTSTKLI